MRGRGEKLFFAADEREPCEFIVVDGAPVLRTKTERHERSGASVVRFAMDRLLKGLPLAFVLTSLGAMSFVAAPYLNLFSSRHSTRSYARDEVSDDSSDNATTRGLMGGGLGLILGLYVAFKKDDDD